MPPRSATQPSNRRSARQQSKEPEAAAAEPSATAPSATRNRGGRHSRENSTEDAVVVGPRKQSARRQNLDTVPEQQSQEQAALDNQQDASLEADADAQLAAAENSRLSGATAVETNISEDELSDIRGKGLKLVENLSQLANSSTSILSFISVQGQAPEALKTRMAEISQPGSIQHQVLTGDYLNLEAYTGDNPYIPVERVIPALLKSSNPQNRPREDIKPDNVLYKINLASLAKTILPLTAASPDLYKKLAAAHDSFPHEFSSFVIAAPINPHLKLPGYVLISAENFNMILELRTQFAKQMLRQVPAGSDPRPVFDGIWHAPEGSPVKEFWGISKPQEPNHSVAGNRIDQVVNRSNEFHECFGTAAENFSIDHGRLERDFPFQAFLEKLLSWIGKIYSDLDAKIASAGGTEEVIKKLKEKVVPPPPPPPPTSSTKAGLKSINNRMKKEGTRKSTGKSPAKGRGRPKKGQTEDAPIEEQQQPNLEPPPPADPNIDPTLQDPAEAAATLVATATQAQAMAEDLPVEDRLALGLQNHATNMGAGGSLLNPQANATKHVFNADLSQPSVQPLSSNTLGQPSSEMQPTQDTGYASQKAGQKRKAPAAAGNASKLQRKNPGSAIPEAADDPTDPNFQNNEEGGNEDQPVSSKKTTKGTRRNKNDDAQPVPVDYVPKSSDYRLVNQQAKTVQAVHGRKPQPKRRPWDLKETDALIDYIEQYGTSWSYIKAVDKEAKWLDERTQVDLKDKARNMKMDYLKSGVALPRNFESIQLDRKATDKLAALGIDYSQTPRRAPRTRDVTVADE